MSRWFRLDDDVINDPKILLLPEAMRWIWIAFLCIASKNGGVLPAIELIALSLRVKTAKAAEYLTRLVIAGLIDKTEMGFEPHNWNNRQFKSDTVDVTAAERMRRYRALRRNGRNGDGRVTVPTDTEQNTQTERKKDAEPTGSGAEAPIVDPSAAERDFFARGREVLGKSAGGQLAKLLKSKGGNVALARSALESASQKNSPSEYLAGAIRAPPAKPLTEHQRAQHEAKEILHELGNFARGGSGSGQEDLGLLSDHSGQRPEAIRGGTGQAVIDVSAAGGRPRNGSG